MTNPNSIVGSVGEQVDLIRVTDAVFDNYDELDEPNSTIETVSIDAVVSQPTERDLTRIEGRVEAPTIKLTVDSNTDIEEDRLGRPDRIRRGGKLYEVAEVTRDSHPLVDAEKTTVICEALPGRA